MTIYPPELDYQKLVTAYENAKELFKAAKAKRKALETKINALDSDKRTNRPIVTYFQYQKALLEERSRKTHAYIAKLQLKERIKFHKAFINQPKNIVKIEGIETLLFKNKYGT